MNRTREVLLAVIVGVSVGLAAAWGIWEIYVNRLQTKPVLPVLVQAPATKPKVVTLKVEQPQDNLASKDKEILVSGKIENASFIVISSPIEDKVVKVDNNNFVVKITLEEGTNDIFVTAYPKNGTPEAEISQVVKVNYTSDEF